MKVMAIQGKYTWERLQDWYRRLLDSRMGVRGAILCEIDPKKNRITIVDLRDSNPEVVAEVMQALAARGVPKGAVELAHLPPVLSFRLSSR